jgi:RNA polymerase sigma-70 factor, ECF subfamily
MVVDLEDTIRELAPGLIRYCTARTHDRSLAEEIAQESLAALVQRCRTHGEPDFPQAFVFAVARRRATRAVLRRHLWLPLHLLEESRDQAPDPEATALGRSECAILGRALERLPARDREVLLLVALGGLKIPEASQALGISESALKMRVMRGRQRLRALLENGHESARR